MAEKSSILLLFGIHIKIEIINTMNISDRTKKILKNTNKTFLKMMPILIGVMALMALLISIIPTKKLTSIFTGNTLIDPFIGSFLGSILSGNPIVSYVIGNELLQAGVSTIAVAAFMASWVTVGIVQAPAEMLVFNKRFTIYRNVIAFVSAVIIAILTVNILG
ncbi:MAG: hypothetical protein AB7T22_05415 [Calditrichaceae bacterium]